MKKYTFTSKDVLDKVIEIGNRFPDFVYTDQGDSHTCSYIHAGFRDPDEENPLDFVPGRGCIVGQALLDLGVTVDDLEELDNGVYSAAGVLGRLIGFGADDDIIEALNEIQNRQDLGKSWGEAVANVVV